MVKLTKCVAVVLAIALVMSGCSSGGKKDASSKVKTKGSDTTLGVGDTTPPTDATGATITTVKGSKSGSGGSGSGGGGSTQQTLPSTQGATRVGVSATEIKWGLHAPKTLQGVPWGLADDVLQGVRIYLNQVNQQKVNGRTIREIFADDRYDTNSGKAAGDRLITDQKVFFAEGTLGVDQIAQVAKIARTSKPSATPYLAGGGSESKFKDIGMYQVGGSYDSHLIALVHFLDSEAAKPACPTPLDGHCPLDKSPYGGHSNTKLKVGISALNSEYIAPAVDATVAAINSSKHLQFTKKVTVEKPEGGAQTTYTNQVLQLSDSDVVIPAQDPLSTSGEVRECRAQAATCHFKWAMSDFAHDGDVDLALMGGTWTGFRGLSGGCYYLGWNQPVAAKCAKLKTAHDLWITGTDPAVDNGDGDKGTGDKQSESTWQSKGQSGIAGYQLVHIWLKALKDAGPDLTREKFFAALNSYSGYDDLIGVPITYQGSSNTAHGASGFAIYQAGAPDSSKPKGVGWAQLSDGLIGSF
jgi:ABC-type branched-subunit amino acid transport system substrate-binding protein